MAEPQEVLHFLDYWRVIRSRKEIVIAVSLLLIVTGILVTYSMPKVYMASALVQVKEDTPPVEIFSRDMWRFDPLFLRTQFEIIQSGPILREVIRRLNLNEKLGRAYGYLASLGTRSFEQTYKILAGNMRVQQYRDTNLIEIQIFMSEPADEAPVVAAQIANTIAEVYRDQSMSRSRDATERALEALYTSLEDQNKKVQEQEEKVEEIRAKYQIALVSPTRGTDSALPKITMTQLEARLVGVRTELAGRKATYEKVMSLSPEDLRRAAPYLVGDPALSSLVAAKQTAEVEYSKLKRAGLGENHPDVARVKAVIEELEVKISDQLQGLKTGVQADYEAVQAQADTLTALMEEMKASEISAEASGYREFEAARQELERVRRIRDSLEMRYIEERIKLRIPSTTVEVVEPARPVSLDDPVRPKVLLNVLLSILLGVGSGIGLAYFVEYLDTSVKTIEDIERHMGISVLGVIPQKVKPLNDVAAEAAHAEAYRVLRTNIHFSEKFRDGRTLCITSGSVGEGKSLTIFNLAYICAQLGDRVLIVDSDLHRPRQHRLLNAAKNPGLANILVGEIGFPDAVVQTSVPNLDLLPSGRLSAEVHGLLDTEKMRGLIREVKGRYGTVFFDAPPIIGVSDASLLVREMDGTLLVIQHRKYPRAISSRARDMIENVGGNLLGVVLNNINITRDYTYYYYQHHYYSYPQRAAVGDQT